MKKMCFYICPVCGNVIMSVGQGAFSCCGISLPAAEAEKCDENHTIKVESTDDGYGVFVEHEMNKKHYISFIAYVTSDTCEVIKLYPEQDAEVHFMRKGHGMMFAYCNKHGLFRILI